MRTLLSITVGVAVLALAGCGGGSADVSGKVTYKGKPVVFGTVVVFGPDGVPKSGPIGPDGTFRISGVSAGAVKVTVSSPPPPGAGGAAPKRAGRDAVDDEKVITAGQVAPEVAKNWFPLPEQYADPDKSGLGQTLKSGSNEVNLDLK